MSLADTFETRALQWLFTTDSPTRPTAWYIGLYTAAPTDAGGGTEVSGGSYARKSATFSVTGDTATTTGDVIFPTPTADWGTVTHIGVFDALSGGNLVLWKSLSANVIVGSGDSFRIYAGDLDITLD